MPRPKGANGKNTKKRILRSASALFAKRGVGKTSTREIGRAAGVSLAMIHHYYGSKEALYRSCVAEMDAELSTLKESLSAVLAPGRPLPESIDTVVRTCFRFARAHQDAVRLTLREAIDENQHPNERRETLLLPFLDEGASLLTLLLGRSTADLRATLLSLNYLVVRYALTSERELRLTLTEGVDDGDILKTVENHLVLTASRLLGVSLGP